MENLTDMVIEKFEILGDFLLEIHFRDRKAQKIDFGQIHYEGWMKELENLEYFNQASINECGNLAWPNGQDFKPEYLYHWEKYEQYFKG